ncbi:MAG: hypothetical protein H7061_01005 [Bdellovibrionaceae bacterium]|nr:hypothetical protein [Bdellovibrio sp.]
MKRFMAGITMQKFKLLNIFLLIVLGATEVLASGPQCSDLFNNKVTDLQQYYNQKLSKKYKGLDFLLRNPDDFMAEMRQRFESQKKITPANPHAFDFSEMGLPALKLMRDGLLSQILVIGASKRFKGKLFKFEVEELELAEHYARMVLSEVETFLAQDQISYYDVLRISFFYTRAAGFGHMSVMHTPLQKLQLAFDRRLEGFRELSIQAEIEIYEKNQLNIFQPLQKSALKGYQEAEGPFIEAITNKSYLGAIIVPTGVAIDRDVLLRLLSRHDINISGLTRASLQADGFFRPPGDFWNHDLRHETAKYYEKYTYIKEHNLTKLQVEILYKQTDRWLAQFNAMISKIKDAELKYAIELVQFNVHHDSGLPMIPSVFLTKARLYNTVLFYISLIVGKEKSGLFSGIKNIIQGYRIVTQFWQLRLVEEQAMLNSF